MPRAESEVPLGYLDITGHEKQKLNLTQSGTAGLLRSVGSGKGDIQEKGTGAFFLTTKYVL